MEHISIILGIISIILAATVFVEGWWIRRNQNAQTRLRKKSAANTLSIPLLRVIFYLEFMEIIEQEFEKNKISVKNVDKDEMREAMLKHLGKEKHHELMKQKDSYEHHRKQIMERIPDLEIQLAGLRNDLDHDIVNRLTLILDSMKDWNYVPSWIEFEGQMPDVLSLHNTASYFLSEINKIDDELTKPTN